MQTVKNNNNDKVTLYFSRYSYKNHTLVGKGIIYEGLLSNCPNNLLEGLKDYTSYKYVRVYTN